MPELTPASAFLFGVLHAIGCFEPATLTTDDTIDTATEKAYFALGGTLTAAVLAASITAPAYLWFAGRSGPAGALTAAALLFPKV